MTRTRSGIPILPDFNPNSRQRRTHRFLDEVRESLAMGILSPIDDGGLPHVTQLPMGGIVNLADQDVTLTGENFLQDHVQSTGTSDTGTNAGIDWSAVVPGVSGDDITITMADDPAHVGDPTITAVGNDVTVTYNAAGGHDADDVVTAAADPDLNTSGLVSCALEDANPGNVAPTDAAEVELTGGSGTGDFTIEPAGILTQLMSWTATSIVARLDLSGYADGDVIEMLVICDGIEHAINLGVASAAGAPAIERGGAGYLYLTGLPVATETFTITDGVDLETFTFQVAAAVPFDITIGVNALATAANIIVAINADSRLADAVIGFNSAVGQAIVIIVPKNAHGAAGNLVIAQPGGVTNMTDQDLQGGAADAFQGAFTGEYTVSLQDRARWDDPAPLANWVPVACFPYNVAPNLYGISADRGGRILDLTDVLYRVEAAGAGAGGYFVLSLYDAGPPGTLALNDVIRFILGE